MGAFIFKPLLYCYILLLCHAEFISAPHMLNERHAGRAVAGYLSADHLSVGGRSTLSADGMTKRYAKLHPIHVSTTNIEYNTQDNKLEVICTIFTDDFEAALAKQYHAKTDLNKQEMHAAMDALIKTYIATNLNMKANDAPVKLNYLGFEINREATDVYLESDKIPAVKKVDAEVSLLYNLFDDQMNIVHITVNKVRKSERVNYPDKRVEQVF
jgi:hypothetical protein